MAALSDTLYQRISAFLTSLANECKTCFRGETEHCDICAAKTARLILNLLAIEARQSDAPLKLLKEDRMRIILEQLKRVNHPLRAADIVLPPDCSKENKSQALERLIFLGKVVREKKNSFYVYALAKNYQKEK